MLYTLPGDRAYQERLFPNPSDLDLDVRKKFRLDTYGDVIAHFTASSLKQDGIGYVDNSLAVELLPGGYAVSFEPLPDFATQAEQFAAMQVAMLNERHSGLALAGIDACMRTPAWNPMSGYPVNRSDGPSQWVPCMPLGMPITNQRAVMLLHYPPIVAYRKADYLNNMTLQRWAQILKCIGVANPDLYHCIVDVNPIAAPGSGESEYPNDFFPINLTSLFFDNENKGLTYLPAMLELMLDPPANRENPFTLPLLVCGSPLYDPQAPGWFRTRYKDQLPKDANGSPQVTLLQVGLIKITPHSRKPTPYMIANHMIAAGVTGRCTADASRMPNIQLYEAQDLVAATYIAQYANPDQQAIDPAVAKAAACMRWFGNADGHGPPTPADTNDALTICALAQMDLCFDSVKIAPMYTYEEALERCRKFGGATFSPCFGCQPAGPGH